MEEEAEEEEAAAAEAETWIGSGAMSEQPIPTYRLTYRAIYIICPGVGEARILLLVLHLCLWLATQPLTAWSI